MTLRTQIARTSILTLFALTAAVGMASAAQFKARTPTPPPHGFGLKAAPQGGQSQGHTENCNNKSSCNLLIAYCIGHGGDWEETGTPGPNGEPQKGKCTYS